jgi:signal transduction histidine kinase
MLRRIGDGKRELHATVRSLEIANAELKAAQNDVVRAEKLASVGRLSSGIAHEIGNPISVVTGYLALLKQGDLEAAERSEYIRRAEEELERINAIIRQLLDISRSNAGEAKTTAVHALIRDLQAMQTCQPMLAELAIDVDLRAEDDTVRADPDQLRQVFLNLLINAADAIAAADRRRMGSIAISSRTTPPKHASAGQSPGLEIVFKDNGAGIPAEHLPNIFDPFFTTKEPGKGTGLGLAVSFMLIEHMGGTIQAASDEGGTAMTIWLPLAAQTAGRSGSKETTHR